MFILVSSAFFGPMNSMASPIFEYKAVPSTELNITSGYGSPNGASPAIVVDGANTYLVFFSITDLGIEFTTSTTVPPFDDPGNTGSYLRIADGFPITSVYNPQAVLSAPLELYVAWQEVDSAIPSSYIGVAYSTDGLATVPVVINSLPTNTSNAPILNYKLVTSNGIAHVVWTEDLGGGITDIVYGKMDDTGLISTPISLSGFGDFDDPDIAVSGSNVFVSWTDSSSGDILLNRSPDNGDHFGATPETVASTGKSNSKLVASGSTVLVTWLDNISPSSRPIQYSTSSTASSFSFPVTVSDPSFFVTNPQLVSSASNAYLSWENGTSSVSTDKDIAFIKIGSFDGFVSVGPLTNLSSGSGNSLNPRMSTSGTHVHVVWQDPTLHSTSVTQELVLRSSTDSGFSFGGLQIITEDA